MAGFKPCVAVPLTGEETLQVKHSFKDDFTNKILAHADLKNKPHQGWVDCGPGARHDVKKKRKATHFAMVIALIVARLDGEIAQISSWFERMINVRREMQASCLSAVTTIVRVALNKDNFMLFQPLENFSKIPVIPF
jgi:hypothetical protein